MLLQVTLSQALYSINSVLCLLELIAICPAEPRFLPLALDGATLYECQANQPCGEGSYSGGGVVVMSACFPAGRGGSSVSSARVIVLRGESSGGGKVPLPDRV